MELKYGTLQDNVVYAWCATNKDIKLNFHHFNRFNN